MTALWDTDLEFIHNRIAEDGIVAPLNRLVYNGYRWLGWQLMLPSVCISILILSLSYWFMVGATQTGLDVVLLIASYTTCVVGFALYLKSILFADTKHAFLMQCRHRSLQLFGMLMIYTVLPYLMLRLLPFIGYFFTLYFIISALFSFFIVFQKNTRCYKALVESMAISYGRWMTTFSLLGLPCFLYFVISEGVLYQFPVVLGWYGFRWAIDLLTLSVVLPWLCLSMTFLYRFLMIGHRRKSTQKNSDDLAKRKQQNSGD